MENKLSYLLPLEVQLEQYLLVNWIGMKLVYTVPLFEMALDSKVSCLGCRQKQWFFFFLELSGR